MPRIVLPLALFLIVATALDPAWAWAGTARTKRVSVSSAGTEGNGMGWTWRILIAIGVIVVLTWTNTRGLEYGKIVQNLFTTVKTAALAALILAGLILGWNSGAVHANFTGMFTLGSVEMPDEQ